MKGLRLLAVVLMAVTLVGCRACREKPDPAALAAQRERQLLEKIDAVHRRQQDLGRKLARLENQLARLRSQRQTLREIREQRTPQVMHPAEQ